MSRRSLVPLSLVIALVLLLGVAAAGAAPLEPLSVSFINVGQGDSILLQAGDFAVLVDGGKSSAGPTVVAYLHQQALPDIDVMLATHADSDHTGGLTHVLSSGIPVRQVLFNGYPGDTSTWTNFAAAVRAAGLTLTPAQFGQVLPWGETTAYVLNPLPGLVDPEQNDASVVMRLDHGDVRYLLTSDADSSVEAAIVARGTPVAGQILKVGHHGSSYSTSDAFLAAVRPEQAVISVGPNSYGHPAPDTLARLASAGAVTWRTDRDGTVTVIDTGDGYTLDRPLAVYRVLLPLTLRQEPAPTATPTTTASPAATATPSATSPPPPSSSTPTATSTATPTTTASPTATATPSPTSPPPPPPNGANVVCNRYGAAEMCAWVANGTPGQNSTQTVYGRLLIDNVGQSGRAMNTTWHYKTTTSTCSGTTGANGVASCSRSIGRATVGYRVNVDVVIEGYSATTWFVPN